MTDGVGEQAVPPAVPEWQPPPPPPPGVHPSTTWTLPPIVTAEPPIPAPFVVGGYPHAQLTSVRWPLWFVLLVLAITPLVGLAGGAVAGFFLRVLGRDPNEWVYLAVYVVPYLVMLALVGAFVLAKSSTPAEALGLRRFKLGVGVGYAMLAAVVARFFAFQSTSWLVMIGLDPATVTQDLTGLFPSTTIGTVFLVLTVVIIGPFAEEVTFRGVLYPALRQRWGMVAAIAVSSILFGVIHLDLWVGIPAAFMGVLLCRLYESSRSLWPAYFAHVAYNASAMLLLLVLQALDIPV